VSEVGVLEGEKLVVVTPNVGVFPSQGAASSAHENM
jgi:hypothetical protein